MLLHFLMTLFTKVHSFCQRIIEYSHIFCINTLTVSNDNSSFRNFINLYTHNHYPNEVIYNPNVNFFIQSSIKKIEPCRKFKIPDASKHRAVTRSRGVVYNIKMYNTWISPKNQYAHLVPTNVFCSNSVCGI